jgi:heat shock protein HslJ
MANIQMRNMWGVCAVAVLLSACTVPTTSPTSETTNPAMLVGMEWGAVEIEGVVPVVHPQPRLRWITRSQIAGSGGCNGFTGTIQSAGDSIRVGPLAATGKACLTAPTGQEDLFFKAVEEARSVRLEGNQLWLLASNGKMLMRLVKVKE